MAALALTVLASGCTQSLPPTGIALENVTIVDAVGGVRTNQRVVVEDELIVAVGEMSEPVGGELLLSPQSVEIIKFGDPGSGR